MLAYPSILPVDKGLVCPGRSLKMSRRCEVCGKGPMSGHNVSHATNRTKRRFYPNLQKVRVLIDKRPVTLKICARCLKSLKYPRLTGYRKQI